VWSCPQLKVLEILQSFGGEVGPLLGKLKQVVCGEGKLGWLISLQ